MATGPPSLRSDAVSGLRRDRLAATLVALFGAADTSIADDLLELGEWSRIPGGCRLFCQGDPGDSMYVVVAGRLVAICEDAPGRRRVVGQIRAGECVGEMGLLASQPRTATVQASRDTVVIRISEQALQQVVARHPQFIASTARLLIRRTTDLLRHHEAAERAKNIAVVPLRRSVACSEFVERLRRALQRRGPTLVVDRARAEAMLSDHGLTRASGDEAHDFLLSTWLDEQELHHDSLVFDTGPISDAWTERSLRQADVVLLLAPFEEAADLRADEARLARADPDGPRRELVLLHRGGADPPRGTGRWLATRAVTRHHHVRWERDDDFARLARFLTGGAIGLVLGGGGARGFAHLGVIRALREAGIPLDAVGGTSQGAIVAATVALDWDDATIERVHRDGFTRRNPIGDYALVPHVALVKGKRLDEALQRCFGDREIEDTWRPFFCTSADLALARCEVHRRGLLWKALRAGVSIPGLLPPAVMGEHLHVDGALLDNLPVEAMRASGVGRIIAVDLGVRHERHMTRSELPSAADFVRERLLGGGERPTAPGLGSILVKSLMLSSVQRAREASASVDLLLEPEPAEIGFLEWTALDRAIALGYRYAKQELARRRDVEPWAHA
jgi:NTE family protein